MNVNTKKNRLSAGLLIRVAEHPSDGYGNATRAECEQRSVFRG